MTNQEIIIEVEKELLNIIGKEDINVKTNIENSNKSIKRFKMFSQEICLKKWENFSNIDTKKNNPYLMMEIIKDLNLPILDRLDKIEIIIKNIRKYIKIDKVASKNHGEVFTPDTLVSNMLDKLSNDVWYKPYYKWVDICNGVGNFMIIVIKRLMVSLKDYKDDKIDLTNDEVRYRHILENMIYVSELQSKNMFFWIISVDPKSEYNLNVYRGSSLDDGFDNHMKNVWKVNGFDVEVGNPPYNTGQDTEGKRGGGDTLWDEFVIKSLKILNKNGLLCYVHPTIWRKPQSERSSSKLINSIMMNKQINYLEMHNSKDGLKTFDAGTRYDFYIMENCDIYKPTIINDEDRIDSEIDLRDFEFIPNKGLELFSKLLATDNDEKCEIIFNVSNYETRKNWVSETKNNIYKYTLIHSTPKKGTRYMYSSKNDNGHFGIPKVIFGESGIGDVIIDMNGEFGMTQGAMAIKVYSFEDAEKIKIALLSDKFTSFLESVLWSNFRIDWRLFTYLKKDFWKEF